MDETLKTDLALVREDINSGILKVKDINTEKVRSIGKKIVDSIRNEIDQTFKTIKDKIFKEVSNDLGKIQNIEKKVEDKVAGFFRSILPGGK